MISQSILLDKLFSHCRQGRLEAACGELLEQYKFDCVFLAKSPAPEEAPAPMAFSGKEEVMETCLYRLGVEERIALTQVSIKTYSDMTGKPVFNRSGSLRIQKPNSGVFMALHQPKKYFMILGCAHQNSQAYDPKLLDDLRALWRGWRESLDKLARPAGSPGTAQNGAQEGEASRPKPDKGPASAATAVPSEPLPPKADGRRPLVLVDEVTRLFNRDYFNECISIEVERARRYSRNMSVIFLSVMPAGPARPDDNSVAAQVAEILSKSLRKVDFICRLEKDKYGIILPDTADNTYGVIAKRIFKFFKLVMGEAPPVFLNISASTYPKHATTHHTLLDNAERLLQQAREAGPNKAVLPE